MKNIIKEGLAMIRQAREEGASKSEMREMMHFITSSTGWHPTKKRASSSKEERNKKRKITKKARKTTYKYANTISRKGSRFTNQER